MPAIYAALLVRFGQRADKVAQPWRIVDEAKGTAAVTRVLIDASDGNEVWGTIGVSDNVIAASWEALVESLERGMLPRPKP